MVAVKNKIIVNIYRMTMSVTHYNRNYFVHVWNNITMNAMMRMVEHATMIMVGITESRAPT